MTNVAKSELDAFAENVLNGLSAKPKHLSSRYFYDDEGSRLFMEIMKLPEYYLTRAETAIFNSRSREICNAFLESSQGAIDVVELGAGDGAKTAILIDCLIRMNADFSYLPIDISQEANDALAARFSRRFPTLRISPLTGDYLEILDSLKTQPQRRKIILFLGSNIGNFTAERADEFFRSLRQVMNPDDRLFIGFDLQKDPRTILAAYDDSKGVTAAFNLNLLSRINRELGADFDPAAFSHFAIYNPADGAARSFLISRKPQSVKVSALGKTFDFDIWEPIFMEISQKFTFSMIAEQARRTGFTIKKDFIEPEYFYLDSLWQPV
jgi:L-histidine N-alpha-methyltransferase